MSRPVVLLSLVRAPAQPPQHAYFGSRSHTPSSRCLRFERRVAATPARLAPVLLARLWTDQTCTGKLTSASPIAPRIRLLMWVTGGGTAVPATAGSRRLRHSVRSRPGVSPAPHTLAPSLHHLVTFGGFSGTTSQSDFQHGTAGRSGFASRLAPARVTMTPAAPCWTSQV